MTADTAGAAAPRGAFGVRLLAAGVVLVGLAFVQDPGFLVPDTKFDLVAAPLDFLGRALHLWNGEGTFGQLQNQAYGYLWPMGPFFALGDLLGAPGWVVQRSWLALVMVVALVGTALLARALGVRSDLACLLAGFAFATSPRMLTTLGPISVEAWPSAVAPWVLLPLVVGSRRGSPRRAAALSALAIACVGGVNAAATFAVVPAGAVWLLTRTPGPRRRALMLWWPVFTLLGTLWWLVPLFAMGAYSPPFLDFIESAAVTTFPTTPFDVLRGTSNWVPYVTAASRAGNDLLTTPYLVLNSGVVLLLGFAGLVDRRTPHRAFLAVTLTVGVLMVSAGHQGAVQGWFAEETRGLLDAALAPLRNVHKFDVGVRLPLVLGLAFAVDRVVLRPGGSTRPGAAGGVAIARSDTVNRVAVLSMAVAVVVGSAVPVLLGRLAPAGATAGVPAYWTEVAQWLEEHDEGGTSLVLPGASFGEYVWGAPRDEPLQFLARSPWAVRDAIPLTPPGTIRMLDRIESELAQGIGSAALAEYLARAGVEHVVVRNDLVRDDDVPDPVLVHQALEDSPGLARVAAFGPAVGGLAVLDRGDDGERLVANGGWQSTYPAVEVYRVTLASSPAVAGGEPPVVVGGPEDLLDLLRLDVVGGAPTQLASDLAGDRTGQAPAGGVVLTDGLRARERQFGRVHDAASPVRTPGDVRRSGNPTRDYLLGEDDRWSTTAALSGARAVAASSSASDAVVISGARRGRLPYAAVDGDPASQWVANPFEGARAWWELSLEAPRVVSTVQVVGGWTAASDQRVRVRTDAGTSEVVELGPGESRRVPVPAGTTSTVRVEEANPSTAALALGEVDLVGVDVRRRLVMPDLPESWGNPSAIVIRRDLDRRRGCVAVEGDVRCVAGREWEDEEAAGMGRTFRTAQPATWDAALSFVPRAGAGLDALALVDQPLTARASSVAVPDPRASAVAAVDGRPGTTWLAEAADERPRLRLDWLGERTVRRISVQLDEDAAARAPERVALTWDGGRQVVDLEDGSARVQPFRSDGVELTVLRADGTRSLDFDATALDLGVGVSEVRLDGVDYLPLSLSADPVRFPCGSGPDLLLDGRSVRTAVVAPPRDLAGGELVSGRLCGGSTIDLPAGEHVLDVPNAPGVALDALVLRADDDLPLGRAPTALPWKRTEVSRTTVAPGSADVLVWRQNANDGWVARRDGEVLEPVVVDGWQQAWRLDGAGGGDAVTVRAAFAPDRWYRAGLLGGLVCLLILLAAVLVLSRRAGPRHAALRERRVPTSVLALVAVGAGGLVGGWAGAGVVLAVAAVAVTRLPGSARRHLRPLVPWAAAAPCLVAAAAYAATPWGSSDGWAGGEAWVGYLVLVPPSAALLAAREPRAGTSTRRRARWAGRSTNR